MTEHTVVLVEGYDDRAFWSGYLRHVCGCVPSVAIPAVRRAALPAAAHPLLKQTGGTYSYLTPTDAVIHVIPYQGSQPGAEPLRALLRKRLAGRGASSDPLRGVVVCTDDDRPAGAPPRQDRAWLAQLLAAAGVTDLAPPTAGEEAAIRLIDGTLVFPVHWRAAPGPDPALPAQQSLERVVCAALQAVHPARVQSAREWLARRPSPPADAKDHKAMAGTLWAGWAANDGWARFYEALWEDGGIRQALLGTLPALGHPLLGALLR